MADTQVGGALLRLHIFRVQGISKALVLGFSSDGPFGANIISEMPYDAAHPND